MEVVLEIEYITNHGEQLWVSGDVTAPMSSQDDRLWRAEVTSSEMGRSLYNYHYEVRRDSALVRREEANHSFEYQGGFATLHLRDCWQNVAGNSPLESALFTDVIYRRKSPVKLSVEADTTIIECRCVAVKPDEVLAVVGVSRELGHWQAEQGAVMCDGDYPVWRVAIPRVAVHTDYKFVILKSDTREVVAWELGDNRTLVPFDCNGHGGVVSVVSNVAPSFDIVPWRGRGVAIPIFSLRTDQSMGVGDFGDIPSMVDWAVARGMSVIQILPINDTTMNSTWEDSYPYNANSTIALHPQYLALRSVGEIEDSALRESFEQRASELEALAEIDYTAVSALKMEYLRVVFATQMEALRGDKSYTEFFDSNSWWLEPYALFSVLRDRYNTPEFGRWGDDAIYSDELLARHKSGASYQDMEFYYFLQYHLHIQLSAASDYARAHGVALKGDIPIGISRTSVDAWIYPELFRMSSQAGAPPDPFSDLGQNWGFPTYNWERMAEDNYAWWRARFVKMADYFDAYRIDHILGFFRIWEIPIGTLHGLTGQFNPALPLSLEEIEAKGFPFNERFTKPFIENWVLEELFEGEDIEQIKSKYFNCDGAITFKPEYDNQAKIAASVESERLRDALMMLHNEVLFVVDNNDAERYHPRIMAQSSRVYRSLRGWEKLRFNELHDDFYFVRHNDFWRDSALRKLPTLIHSTNMLVCGEDLGMIPACVAEVMEREQILSLEIERMPKAMGVAFATPAHYPYLSVCTCSTHDMATIRGWWREDRELTQRYYNEALGLEGVAPKECSVDLARMIIERHISSPAMLTILPWQDWMAVDEQLRRDDVDAERINVPANSRHYWRYRMHLKL